ncbi:MAG: response regulator [Kofleriaceae bacterium]|nr:response regulator [Kofleriaceae bacterium]
MTASQYTPLVLNVNDHVANLYMVSKMLKNAGFRVLEARSGGEALEIALRDQPELIVLDVHLPDLSGIDVCRRLKTDERTQHIKVIHTSATFVSSTNKTQGVEAGADGYLTQPFEPQELIATVRSLIRLKSIESDLVTRNDALVSADRRKDEFLAMLGHELRNPLAALSMALPILERFPPRDDIEARTIGILRRQMGVLTQLVDDLLDVSRVTRGRIELTRSTIDLRELIHRVVEGIDQRVFAPRQQKLALDLAPQPFRVSGDAVRLEQVMTNLLDNSSKYSDPGTTIEVSLVADGTSAVVRVRDHGVGIDAATLPIVFDLFAQATTSLDRARGGLGIGLTLVRSLVELHGGTISAASDGIGHGTTMTIRLPLVDEVAQTAVTQAAQSTSKRRVLVVDDNVDGREILRYLCEHEGHEVIEAGDGPEGVQRLLDERPDVAFVDIGLPTFDGFEVARRVRARLGTAAPRLIALSGYGSDEHRARALEAGFDEHMAKPIQMDQLRRTLAN